MGDFSWNLGPDAATAAGQVEAPTQESAVPGGLSALGLTPSAPVVPAQQALSRRELREREAGRKARPVSKQRPVGRPATRNPVTKAPRGLATKASASTVRPAPRPPRSGKGFRRALFSKLVTIGAMLGVGALMVSTSLPPASAFYRTPDTVVGASALSTGSQSVKVAAIASEPATTRDSYTVTSLVAQLRLKYGNQTFLYTNDPNGTIQWPFPVPVPISSGFGPRIAPCGGCSSVHEGIDFIPGAGVVIDSIADGVVSQVIPSHAGLGNHVVVDHVINGQKVQSVYGHMLDGSFKVHVGDKVTVTQPLGQVGSTGESTGAHLHLEIHINGVPVDPFAWLKANAN